MRGKTYNYLKDKGYNVKFNEIVELKQEEIPDFCVTIEERKCDCCNRVFERPHRDMVKIFNDYHKDICQECISKEKVEKSRITNLEKYGVDNPLKNKNVRQKMVNTIKKRYGTDNIMKLEQTKIKAQKTCKEHFGVDFPMQSKVVRRKSIKTLKENYGVDNPNKSEQIHNKAKETCVEKYGVDNPFKSEKIKKKIKKTNIEKYGVENPMQSPEIRQKAADTLASNGSVPTSTQQLKVFELCQELYPDYEISLNVPVLHGFVLNMVLIQDNIKINIEYDGWYWHQDKNKDINRDKLIMREGYKVLRIRSGNLIPTKEELTDSINILLTNQELNYLEIKLSDWKLE